jgi:immune inhibitor A
MLDRSFARRTRLGGLHPVPPAPEVLTYLVYEYHKNWKELGFSFRQFLVATGYENPAHNLEGLDDDLVGVLRDGEVMLISIPKKPITGNLHVLVLLVDFPDLPGRSPKEHYEDLLFSQNTYPTGSMADYYHEVSRDQVNITGEVYGWLRMPQNYTYYTNGHSGMADRLNREYYPRDARRLAEDAVEAALAANVQFDPKLDIRGNGTITALFIVHAGLGAEKRAPFIRGDHIWSHKWDMKQPKKVAQDLWAKSYLIVPQEALLGVCAHELGHLAFQWQDFYDPNFDDDGDAWDGTGIWDLMASGSYAGKELRPIHPAGLHKLQHGWVPEEELDRSRAEIVLKPVTDAEGKVLKIRSKRYQKDQYLSLEYRAKQLFDTALPGEGLLVWRVDESEEQEGSRHPGMTLIQADGRHNLLDPDDRNDGDPGDPFPGSTGTTHLLQTGNISTSFPGEASSGVSLENIRHDPSAKEIRFELTIQD